MLKKRLALAIKDLMTWIQENKVESLVLAAILLLAGSLRLYRIEDFMVFLGDEGRDALVVKRIIVDHKWTLLGPTASVGGMFLGPIYYYFMIPFLWIFRFEPVGPAIMVALFGVATVFLIYKAGREFFGSLAGILAALLYSVAPLVIVYSRSSWNPNILPFFSLLTIYFLTKALGGRKQFFFLSGASLGVGLQLHYLASFLFFVAAVSILLFEPRKVSRWLSAASRFLLGFLFTFSPFILFELRHRFPNTRSLWRFIFAGKEVGFQSQKLLPIISNVFFRLFETVVSDHRAFLATPLMLFVLVGAGYLLRQKRLSRFQGVVLVWISVGCFLFGFYQKPIYDYYLGFLFPAPFLLLGLVGEVLRKGKVFLLGFLALALVVFGFNLKNSPAFGNANRQVEHTKNNVRDLLEKTEGQPFNFALITGGNSDHAYRYFMEIWGRKPVVLTHEPESITDQLMVICETKPCGLPGHSLWEIAGFGRSEIVNEWKTPDGKIIYKLVHYQGDGEG